MSTSLLFYSIAYSLLSSCIIYPPSEVVSVRLTIKHLFAEFLGSENEFFIEYHIKRTIVTLIVHSLLPLGYVLGLIIGGNVNVVHVWYGHQSPMWLFVFAATLLGPLYVLQKIIRWYLNNWSTHPIAKNLAVFRDDNETWLSVAKKVNAQYRRVDKIVKETTSITSVIVTENWIIKVTSYTLHFAHQNDTALIVTQTDTHTISPNTRGEIQFVNIEVNPTRPGAEKFNIRMNVLDFKDFEDRVNRRIIVLDNVVFHRTLLDRFIDAFKTQVAQNPVWETSEELEQCVGCMQAVSNVKLNKQCDSNTGSDACAACFCRPMWCVDCMAKWFASRQDESTPENWLASKCTCPLCRSKFCMLDVSLVTLKT